MVFLYMFVIPLIFSLIIFLCFKQKITLKEWLVQVIVCGLLSLLFMSIIYHNKTADIEILHGEVIKKYNERVSCEHSYSCNCREECSGSNDDRSCSTVCDTCYRHSYDVNWIVQSNIGNSLISRVDERGIKEPSRFSQVIIGEPFAKTNVYENYIKGSPDTLFKSKSLIKKYEKLLLPYPEKVYDYYRINRLVVDQKAPVDYNQQLSNLNKKLGILKKASVGMVILHNKPEEMFYALREYWLGGKKNDVIPVISIDTDGSIQWVYVLAWTKNDIFQVTLRDNIMDAKNITNENAIFSAIENNIHELYVRKPMKEFEYLKESIKPSFNEWLVAMIIELILCGLISYLIYHKDLFNEE